MSMRRILSLANVVVLFVSVFNSMHARAMSPETNAKLNEALRNWRSVSAQSLIQPENADLLDALREMAQTTGRTDARVPLLKLGDSSVIQDCLAELRAEPPHQRDLAVRQLGFAGNPKIIALLEPNLSREESAEILWTEDIGFLPVSMAAAAAIKAIVLQSSDFSMEVKVWAQSLPVMSPGLRDGVRAWWRTNKAAIERGDFRAVVPGEIVPRKARKQSNPVATQALKEPMVTPQPAVSQTLVPVDSPARLQHKRSMWPWLVGIGVLGVILLLVLRRRV